MVAMFDGATAFNSDISRWNVEAVLYMRAMFFGATALTKTSDAGISETGNGR